jgi:hypothetical protein
MIEAADGVVPNSMHDFFEALLLPGAVARIGNGPDFFDEIFKAVDLGWRPTDDGFQNRNDFSRGHVLEAILVVRACQ